MSEQWSIAAGHVPGPLTSVLLAAALGALAFEAVSGFVRREVGPRRTILALRVLALLALVALAFEPSLRIESLGPTGRRIVALVDVSRSEAIADAVEPSEAPTVRHERARALWQASESARAAWVDDGTELEVRTFADERAAMPGSAAQTLDVPVEGHASDLAAALEELVAEGPEATPLVGVVVVSDGLVAPEPADAAHLDALVAALGLPITTAATGAPELVDVALGEVRAGDFAFVENVTEIEVDLVAHGLGGAGAQVELLRDGEPLERRPITLGPDGVPRRIRFEVAPDRVGQFVMEVRASALPGEATLENNRRAFVLKVLRDKVRILHVAGRPDWDVRALRTLLKRDPNVELLSYYILRDLDDIDRSDDRAELSLIQFPTEELFGEELGSFDLVVLHNFDAERHGAYHRNFARYVQEGGALVVIGGDLGLATGDYAHPDLAATMPIETREPTGLSREPFRPRSTDAGRRHPITAWLAASTVGWESLPELDSFNPSRLVRDAESIGAVTLLAHPGTARGDHRDAPLLAVAEPGKGRTLAITTGATWRLGFSPDLPLVDGARPYDLLWLGAVRWLLRDGSSERLVLDTEPANVPVGRPVRLRARTLSASYAPEPAADVEWQVRTLDPTRTIVAQGRWTTDGLGRAEHTLEDLAAGAYEVTAQRSDADEERTEAARRVFLVEAPTRELADLDADPGTARLARIAEASGGHALVAHAGDALPVDLPRGEPRTRAEGRVQARREIPLWNGWLALALFVLAFPVEWLVRRRHGAA
jgi:hypothetical protein